MSTRSSTESLNVWAMASTPKVKKSSSTVSSRRKRSKKKRKERKPRTRRFSNDTSSQNTRSRMDTISSSSSREQVERGGRRKTPSPNEPSDRTNTESKRRGSIFQEQPQVIQFENHKTGSEIGYYTVAVCFILAMVGLLLYPSTIYRDNIRLSFYGILGSKININGEYEGGHRELASFLYLFLSIGLPTMIGAIAYTLSNGGAAPSYGVGRITSRFFKRMPFPKWKNITLGECIFLIFIVWINVYWFFSYSQPFSDKDVELEHYGETFGLMVVINMVFLGIPATRNSFWLDAIGIDYARGIKYHRWLGIVTFVLLIAHIVPYVKKYNDDGILSQRFVPCFDCGIGDRPIGRASFQNFFGIIAFVALLVMMLTSISYVRRNNYELFYYCHHLYIIVLIGATLHYSNFVFWLYPTICLYMVHRILSNTQSRRPVEVVECFPLPGGVTRVVFRRSLKQGGQFVPGQFLYLRVPDISKIQWHAFSISSYPEQSPDCVSVHIRGLGDWTWQLHALAIASQDNYSKPLMYVDGYYGLTTHEFERYPVLVFIAGGIGATPLLSMIGHLLHEMAHGNYSQINHIYFYWTSRESAIFQEFGSLLESIRDFDPSGKRVTLHLFYTGQATGTPPVIKLPEHVITPTIENVEDVTFFPIHQSACSPHRRAFIFSTVFLLGAVLLFFIRRGYPILGGTNQYQNLWPLQRLAELFMLFVAGAAAYVIAAVEKRPVSTGRTARDVKMPLFGRDLEAGRSQQIEMARINVPKVLAQVKERHVLEGDAKNAGIGVWVSGPKQLIRAVETESAVHLGYFDVHSEEFNL